MKKLVLFVSLLVCCGSIWAALEIKTQKFKLWVDPAGRNITQFSMHVENFKQKDIGIGDRGALVLEVIPNKETTSGLIRLKIGALNVRGERCESENIIPLEQPDKVITATVEKYDVIFNCESAPMPMTLFVSKDAETELGYKFNVM